MLSSQTLILIQPLHLSSDPKQVHDNRKKKELQWTSTFCDYDHKSLNGKVGNLLYSFLLECGLLRFISRKFAHTWQVKPDGIIGVKFERTRIHFQCCRSGCVNFQILSTGTVPLFTHICLCYIMFFTLFYFIFEQKCYGLNKKDTLSLFKRSRCFWRTLLRG